MNTLLKKMGRLPKLDPRDHKYLIKNNFTFNRASAITQKYWNPNGWWGDQGDTPHCVGYSWAHWIEDGPVEHAGAAPIIRPNVIYEGAQKLDEWPGENYDGSSVRGGVKYLASRGFVKSYYWAFDVNTISQYVLHRGPIVVGTNWYSRMFTPDRAGLIRVAGRLSGGHAYVINGVDMVTKRFRIKNSWGRTWGKGGMAFISFTDMAILIAQQGEACVAVEATDAQLNS
jgi:hypothetical protein